MFVDLAIGLGLPFLQMILRESTPVPLDTMSDSLPEIVVEGRRFQIYERIGCQLNVFNTALAYPLFFVWPPVISFIILVYSCAFSLPLSCLCSSSHIRSQYSPILEKLSAAQ